VNEQGQARCYGVPCFWSVELPNSRGNASYAPPVVSASPGRVFVATTDAGGGGTIWSFAFDGGCRWGLKPDDNDDAQGGFYARPAVGPPAQGHSGVLLYAPSFKNSRMHVIFESDGAVTRPCPAPPAVSPGCHYVELFRVDDDPESGGAQVDFEPIVEPCPTGDDAIAGCFGRVYVGGEQGSSKRGLYAFNVGATNAPDLGPWTILDPALTMRLGGVVLDGSDDRFLVANLDNQAGVAVFDLDRAESGGCSGSDATKCFAIHDRATGQRVEAVHRSRPVKVYEKVVCDVGTCRPEACTPTPLDPGCLPVVYLGQKEGGTFDGGQVWKFRLTGDAWLDQETDEERWYGVFDDAWGKDGSGGAEPWPACAGEGIPTTSWSSPVVHPLGEYVFLGSRNGANGAGGLYRLAQPDDDGCPAEREATNWFPYIPANGWRTTAVFTGVQSDEELVHFGSSEDEVFALRTFAAGNGADVCAQVEWCEDLNTGVGGACDSPNGIACCQAAGCS
jgi:hypothetical protein